MARPSEGRRFEELNTLLNYYRGKGMFDGGERSLPISQVAADLGMDEDAVVKLSCELACTGEAFFLVPVYIEEVDGQTRVFSSAHALPKGPRLLTAFEALALLKALETEEGPASKQLAESLGNAMPPGFSVEQAESVILNLTLNESEKSREIERKLNQAISQHRIIRFAYRKPGQAEAAMREVEPISLKRGDTGPYLNGFCLKRKALRSFVLSRMEFLSVTGRNFSPRDIDANDVFYSLENESEQARLRFSPESDIEQREWLDMETQEPDGSGYTEATLPYIGGEWLPNKVAGQLGDVEALEPPELRAKASAIARARFERASKSLELFEGLDRKDLIQSVPQDGLTEETCGLQMEELLETLDRTAS